MIYKLYSVPSSITINLSELRKMDNSRKVELELEKIIVKITNLQVKGKFTNNLIQFNYSDKGIKL